MSTAGRQAVELAPDAATLDAHHSEPSADVSSAVRTGDPSHVRAHKVALVEGSGPQLSGETTELLRIRLRAAALVLVVGFIAFFVYRLFFPSTVIVHGTQLVYARIATVVLLAGCAASLLRRTNIPLRHLRIYEMVIFGAPVIYLAMVQREIMRHFTEGSTLPNVPSMWFAILYIYAMFIPNGWRRAAVVLGAMAATPIC